MHEKMPTAPLADIANFTMGQSPDSAHVNGDERGLPFLQGCAEFGARNPSARVHCFPPLRIAKAGSTLISVRAPVGTMNRADKDYCIGRGLAAILAKAGVADDVFLANAIEHNISYLHRRSQGSTFLAIGSADLKSMSVAAPDLSVQQRIAEILSTVDEAIEQTEALIAKTQQIKAGMMHDLFTRGVTADGQLRPPREEAPKLYKESPLGWIPKEWKVTELQHLAPRIGDGIHTTPVYSSEYTGIHFINGNNLSNGSIRFNDATPCVSPNEHEKHFINLTTSSILYSINGTIGNIAYYRGEKVVLGKSAAFITCAADTFTPYVFYYLQTSFVVRFYSIEMTGSTISNLSLKSIRNTPVKLPNEITEQKLIVERLDGIAQTVEAEEESLAKLRYLKEGLMHNLLAGRISVAVDTERETNEVPANV